MSGLTGVRTRLDGLRRRYRAVRADLGSPLPTVRLELRRTLPAWSLRLVLIALGVAVLVIMRPSVVLMIILVGLLAALALRPGGTTAALWCGSCGLVWTLSPTPVGALTFALIALVPAAYALATTLGTLPLRARVELAALRPSLLRYVAVQAVSQPIVAAAIALRAQQVSLLVVAIVAVGAVAVLAWVLLPRLTED